MKLTNHEVMRASGWLGLLLMELCVLGMWMGSVVHAQAFNTTTVHGTVYLANGQPGTGTLVVSWPTFTTANGAVVAAESMTVAIAPDGFVSVNLAPNQGAAPAGQYYTATFYMSDGSVNTQYWVVPATTSATLGQVQAQVMPSVQAVQTVSKTYVDQAIASLAGGVLTITGTTMTGPLSLCCDPTTPLQAADKHYVDVATAQAVPLAGGTLTGPLTATKLGAAYQVDQFAGADFGAKLGACLSGLSATQGGTCDARNFSGTLAMGSNLTISTANATVLLPCATISTANQVIVTAGTRNVSLRGCALRGASTASGSQGGTVFYYSGTGAMMQVGDPTYAADTPGFHLDNAVINITAATSASAQGFAAYRTQELDLESLYFLGNSNQTGMKLDGTGNYTGGTFYDNEFTGFQTALNAIGHQITNPATTDWLNASTFVRLHIDCPTSGGSPISGTYGINLQQGDGNTFTGGDVEGCATALHLGVNAQNNTIVGLRNENSTNQVVADAGSSYNNWMTGGTMFTGKLMDNGTRNSFLDTFHRSFNGLNGDWYGSQADATVTNHYRLGTGLGNERGLLNRYQSDYGYRWTIGLSDATAGEQFYQILDELNNVYRLSIGQYNNGQSSSNNQTVINSAGTGAVVLNGSNGSGTGGVIFGSGGASETTVATVGSTGNAQFNGTLLVGGTSQSTGTMTVRNNADAEVDYYLWPGVTTSQKGSYTYKDWNGNSQWYMVKDASNNWALNSAPGGLDSFKAYQSSNSGDTYIDASNSTGVVRINYETGSGTQFKVYGGNSSSLYASFTGTTSIQFPGLAAGSGHNCLQIDNSGYITNTGTACGGGGGGGSGTVNSGTNGQIAYYNGTGTVLSGTSNITAGSASFSTINNTCMADQQTGIDMGAKIAVCNTALASTGGIIDATGFLGTQYASVGFTIGPGMPTINIPPAYSVTLKLGYVNLIAGGEIKLSPFSHIVGQAATLYTGVDATSIIGNHSNLAVIDMTGCAHCTVENVNISTENPQTNSIPKTGISISRNPSAGCTSGGNYYCYVGNNTIRNVSVAGYFQNAAFYAVESELLTLEHFYGYVYDSAYYPGGVKPKYCMAISQTDVMGLGLYALSTMTMGSVENSECWYYPTGVANSATLYFGGGNKTDDWSFRNVYFTKSNLGSYVEIQTNENGGGNLGGPLIFDNVDGEWSVTGTYPNTAFYIHGPGASPQVNELYIIGGGIMGGVSQYINATANLDDAYIDSQSYMSTGSTTSAFATVWNSTIKLPWQNTTITNAYASTLEGGASSNCSTCGLTVSGTNTSIVEPAYSTGSTTLNSPSFVNPSFTGTMAGATYNSTGSYQLNGTNALITDGNSTYVEPVTSGYNSCLSSGSYSACLAGSNGRFNSTTGYSVGGSDVIVTNSGNTFIEAQTGDAVYIGYPGSCNVSFSEAASTPMNSPCGVANNHGTLLPSTLTGYHGSGAGDVKVQFSDGTGTSGYIAVYDANGGLTNGSSIPASANALSSNSSSQLVASTSHNLSVPANCAAASGSGTAYTCSTSPTFTPATGDHIQFKADVANTGSATLAVNGATAASMKKWGGAGSLIANDMLAGHWISATFDGTYWQLEGQLGNANATQINGTAISGLSGSGSTLALTTSPIFTGNTTTFANNSASTDYVVIQPGTTSTAELGGIQLNSAAATPVTEWQIEEDTSYDLLLYDAGATTPMSVFTAYINSGTNISSQGSGAVTINNVNHSGNGGFIVYEGGANYNTPALTVTSSGNASVPGTLTATGTISGGMGASLSNATSIAATSFTSTGLALPAIPVSTTKRGMCVLIWEQNTAVGTVQFGMGMNNAPTNLWVINQDSPGTYKAPTYTTISSTTTTAVSAADAPSATATGYRDEIEFTLTTGSSNAVTVTVYGLSSSTSDALVIEPGSYCTWLP